MELACFNCNTLHVAAKGEPLTLCCDDPAIGTNTPRHSKEVQWPETVSGVLHRNALAGVVRHFSEEEWRTAREEVFARDNFGWNTVLGVAIRNARRAGCSRKHVED